MAVAEPSIAEQIRTCSEIYFCKRYADLCPQESAIKLPLTQLASQPEIRELLEQSSSGERCFLPEASQNASAPTLSTSDALELHEALKSSKILSIWFDGCQDLVVHRPILKSLCKAFEELLHSCGIAEILASQGPVPLRVILGVPEVHTALQQRGLPNGRGGLETLRLVISVSSKIYKIKGVSLDAKILLKKGFGPEVSSQSESEVVESVLSYLTSSGIVTKACQSEEPSTLTNESGHFLVDPMVDPAILWQSANKIVQYASAAPYQNEVPTFMQTTSTCFELGPAVVCPTPMQSSSIAPLGEYYDFFTQKPAEASSSLQNYDFFSQKPPDAAASAQTYDFFTEKPMETSASLQADADSFLFVDPSISTENQWRRVKHSQSDPRSSRKDSQLNRKPVQPRSKQAEPGKGQADNDPRGSANASFRGRDVVELGKLLTFYFQPFNLQHIRMFCSLVQEQLSNEGTRFPSDDWRPTFNMDDLLALPRLNKHLGKYNSAKARLLVVQKALSESDSQEADGSRQFLGSPVQLSEFGSDLAKLVLTYEPKLRHIVGPGGSFPVNSKIQALLDFEIGPHTSVDPPSPSMFLTLSYSVASELSSCDGRRGPAICSAIGKGGLDASYMSWEARLQQLKRQLLFYRADIMCLQGLQGACSSVCCSEDASHWSCFGDTTNAQSNHLRHLYEELGKANYGMAYAPTIQLSSKKGDLSLGNAVFWDRSRWKLERHFQVHGGSAICVQLASRVGGPRILACSAKPGQTFSLEKGQEVGLEELVQPLQMTSQCLQEEADAVAAVPVLCGDFGCEPEVLQAAFSASLDLPWQSACTEVLGEEPWTSASEFSCGKTVDYVLHDHRLKALAVLDGRPGKADAVELLKAGFPSDHLLMLAALEVSEHVDSTYFPRQKEQNAGFQQAANDTSDCADMSSNKFMSCAALPWPGASGRTSAKKKSKRSGGGASHY